jgi:hypothetical protein
MRAGCGKTLECRHCLARALPANPIADHLMILPQQLNPKALFAPPLIETSLVG